MRQPHVHRLGESARVILFDERGTGLSDRVVQQPDMDARMDDVRAVMDDVGVERAAIMGISEAGSLASLFAATHPERCQALILYGAFARFSSWFPTATALHAPNAINRHKNMRLGRRRLIATDEAAPPGCGFF